MEVREAQQQASARLRPAPDSISAERRTVRAALQGWGLEHLVDTATLLASELASNVVLHARTRFEIRVERLQDGVRVTVLDASRQGAVRRRYGLDAGTGRGLGLVETLSARWDCESASAPWAKAVWFELSDDADAQEATCEGALYGDDWLALVDDL